MPNGGDEPKPRRVSRSISTRTAEDATAKGLHSHSVAPAAYLTGPIDRRASVKFPYLNFLQQSYSQQVVHTPATLATSATAPRVGLAVIQVRRRPALAFQQAFPLISAKEAPKLLVFIPRNATRCAFEISPEHRDTTDHHRRSRHPVERAGQHIDGAGTHGILSDTMSHPAGPPVFMAGPHRPKVREAQFRLVPTYCDPPEHPAAMAVDPVPHQHPYEAPDLLEAFGPIKLDHTHRVLIAAHLADEPAGITDEVRLAAACADTRISFHPLQEDLEVPLWQIEIEVQLADVIEFTWINAVVTRVEGVDDPASELAIATVGPAHDANVGEPRCVFDEDPRALVGRAIIDDDP